MKLILAVFILVMPYISSYAKDRITFVVMGDMPYTSEDNVTLNKLSKAIPLLDPSVLVHYGDFKSGVESCTDDLLKSRRDQIYSFLPHRVVYTPGDNEWTDCDRKYLTEAFDELERLAYIRRLFFKDKEVDLSRDIPNINRQNELPENAMWKIEDLLMGTLHIVGTNNGRVNILKSDVNQTLDEVDRRDNMNRVWLKKLFKKAKDTEGLVVIFHADIYRFRGDAPACTPENRLRCNPYKNIRDDIETMALQYKKPVLIVHGDTNAYCFNKPSISVPNLWHFNGPGDFKVSDAAQIIFDLNNKKEPFEIIGILNPVRPPLECNYNRSR